MTDNMDLARRECRWLWGRVTPYRLGLVAREFGIGNPYPPRSKARAYFNNGVAWSLTQDSRKEIKQP